MKVTTPALDKSEILYIDNHLLIVNKRPGLLVQADDTGDTTLLSLAKTYVKKHFDKPGDVFMGIVQRLDRPASGVIALARTSKAASRLSEQIRERRFDKRYVAIVEGVCIGSGKCVDYLAKVDQKVKIVKQTQPQAQYAELNWRSIAVINTYSLLEIELMTGRPHQIRVQLAHLGFPISGDLRYGATQEFDGQNLALHCYSLTLNHPTKPEERLNWRALPPRTWQRFKSQLVDFCQVPEEDAR